MLGISVVSYASFAKQQVVMPAIGDLAAQRPWILTYKSAVIRTRQWLVMADTMKGRVGAVEVKYGKAKTSNRYTNKKCN